MSPEQIRTFLIEIYDDLIAYLTSSARTASDVRKFFSDKLEKRKFTLEQYFDGIRHINPERLYDMPFYRMTN